MIARHRCEGTLSKEAQMACIDQYCGSFALCCNEKECDCRAMHQNHNMKMFSDVLMLALQPVKLPEDIKKMEKDIETLLDALIANLQQLKGKHRQHIYQHTLKKLGSGTLLRKLKQQEQLLPKEATGSCFHQLTTELGQVAKLSNPYTTSKEQLSQQVAAVKEQLAAICLSIEYLWVPKPVKIELPAPPPEPPLPLEPPKFVFSSTRKHEDIQLQGSHRTFTEKSGLVLLEPSLPMRVASAVSFKVNKKGQGFLVGVCNLNKLYQQKYPFSAGFGFEKGAYMHSSIGNTFSDSIRSDNTMYQVSPLYLEEGDVMRVSLEPTTGLLTYTRNNSKTYQQRTAIRSSTVGPIHYCVWMSDSDLSIVEQ